MTSWFDFEEANFGKIGKAFLVKCTYDVTLEGKIKGGKMKRNMEQAITVIHRTATLFDQLETVRKLLS